ncbi:hypothetical protein BLA60_33990 [Actinophytocola xinjiangensis]|uniref:Uncharacterized protein n=1 Tax=Actinophytocola xinjiangensis TaxID=485602 RepID=A0A7Z1AV78_9PSEU|nr:hypothetical protein [Actinophytocola xinjiangensis]OLF06052.1 hypothetical protein BLA60_33990 [Actinophytocola xinjiangensis]
MGWGEPKWTPADLDGDEPRTLLDGEYNVLSFSADGEYLLGDRYDLEASEPVPGAARVVPVQGGDAVPVTLGEVTYPAWGPRGHAIVYLASPGTVRVVGRPGGEPKVLHDAPRLTAASLDEIYWVRGAIVVGTGEAPVVLTLSE